MVVDGMEGLAHVQIDSAMAEVCSIYRCAPPLSKKWSGTYRPIALTAPAALVTLAALTALRCLTGSMPAPSINPFKRKALAAINGEGFFVEWRERLWLLGAGLATLFGFLTIVVKQSVCTEQVLEALVRAFAGRLLESPISGLSDFLSPGSLFHGWLLGVFFTLPQKSRLASSNQLAMFGRPVQAANRCARQRSCNGAGWMDVDRGPNPKVEPRWFDQATCSHFILV
jgi:hypothetical protein